MSYFARSLSLTDTPSVKGPSFRQALVHGSLPCSWPRSIGRHGYIREERRPSQAAEDATANHSFDVVESVPTSCGKVSLSQGTLWTCVFRPLLRWHSGTSCPRLRHPRPCRNYHRPIFVLRLRTKLSRPVIHGTQPRAPKTSRVDLPQSNYRVGARN